MPMNSHDIAHYGIAAVLAAGLAYGGVVLRSVPTVDSLPPSYAITADQLTALPFGNHPYSIEAAEGSGALPGLMATAIEAKGDKVVVEGDMLSHEGIWVSPDNPEGHALADAISKLIGEPVNVGNTDNGAFEIGIGRPMHKRGAK